ncbi:hypothetical protein [Chamaesiphon sp.]|uniref:hypothetical protein n=1 Tax=Chamaesiphon sp. TaxID=2814140 RepID=UPI00359344BB
MKYISATLANLRPVRTLLTVLLAAVLVFTSGLSALAATSSVNKGVEQLDQIEKKSLETLDNPATTPEEISARANSGLNEIQGDAADRNKMYRSSDPTPPVIKQVEKAIDKLKG